MGIVGRWCFRIGKYTLPYLTSYIKNKKVSYYTHTLYTTFNQIFNLYVYNGTMQAIGTAGLMLILLSPQKRHVVMYPLEEAHKVEVFSEQWEDTIQLLIGKN